MQTSRGGGDNEDYVDVMGTKKGWSRKHGAGDMEAVIGRLIDVSTRVGESLEGARREAADRKIVGAVMYDGEKNIWANQLSWQNQVAHPILRSKNRIYTDHTHPIGIEFSRESLILCCRSIQRQTEKVGHPHRTKCQTLRISRS